MTSSCVTGMPRGPLPDWVRQAHVLELPMVTRFRGLTRRRVMLVEGPAGWAEWSPFEEYSPTEAATWWQATREAACQGFPPVVRDCVPVNVTIPAESPERAHARVLGSRCRTAKVKVAEKGQTLADDLARVEAVRDALCPSGAVRVDANGGWSVDEALRAIGELRRYELEYVEQPCATVDDLARLRRELARRGWQVRIAADESIRRSGDPERVVALEAADVAVIKVQPLGGVRRCLELVERLGLPAVVSSALESSIGLRMGLALAASLPDLPFACGLNTAALLAGDAVTAPLVENGGVIRLSDPAPAPELLTRWRADEAVQQRWHQRLAAVLQIVPVGAPDGGQERQ